jgi:hypothetical protein
MPQAIRVVTRIQDQDDVDGVAPNNGVILVGDGDKFASGNTSNFVSSSDLTNHENLTTDAHGGIVADGDSRLTDARDPTAHAASHATAGR